MRLLPRLPQGDPLDVPHHNQAHYPHSTWTSDCTTLWAGFISYSSSSNPGGMPLDTPTHPQVQFQSVCPRVPCGNRFGLTLVMTWSTCHITCWTGQLLGATDEQGNDPCPPAPSALSSSRPSSGGDNQCHDTPMGEPGQGLTLLHQANLWLPARLEPGTQYHQTKWEAPQTGSGPTWHRESTPQAGGWHSGPLTWDSSMMLKYRSWPKSRPWDLGSLQPRMSK